MPSAGTWSPHDPRSDRLQAEIADLVEEHADHAAASVFEEIAALVPASTPSASPVSIGPPRSEAAPSPSHGFAAASRRGPR